MTMYATAQDLRDLYGELPLVQLVDAADWAGALVRIETELSAAACVAEGYVTKYYAPSPTRAVPPLLTQIVCRIAFAGLSRSPTDEAKERRAEAMRMLRDIANGHIKIDQGQQDIPARAGAVIVPNNPRIFSRDNLGGF